MAERSVAYLLLPGTARPVPASRPRRFSTAPAAGAPGGGKLVGRALVCLPLPPLPLTLVSRFGRRDTQIALVLQAASTGEDPGAASCSHTRGEATMAWAVADERSLQRRGFGGSDEGVVGARFLRSGIWPSGNRKWVRMRVSLELHLGLRFCGFVKESLYLP